MTVVIGIAMAVIQLVVGLLVAFLAIYLGIRLFDRIIRELNLVEELKLGNIAVGIFIGGLLIAIATVIQSGVQGITSGLNPGMGIGRMLIGFIAGLAQLGVGVVLAILAVYIAVRLFDRVARGVNIIDELRNRNISVGILTAIVLVAVGFIIQSAVAGIARPIGIVLIP